MVREIPFKIMSRAFRRQREFPDKPSDRELFWTMVNAQFDALCRTSERVRYSAMDSMLSGAWCTTDANTILNAFIRYAGLRRSGLSRQAAWRAIGLVFGDDSAA